jgi:hypothetical protein
MSRTYKYWTKEDDALLRDLRAEKYPSDQIADHMGRTKSSISNRIVILGLPVRKFVRTPKPVVRPWYRMGSLMAMLTGRK